MRTWIVSVVFAVGAACGGKQMVAPAEHHEDPAMEHEEASMPPDLKAFHDVLAPIYHTEAAADRVQQACDQGEQMSTLAAKVENGDDLAASVESLREACNGGATADDIDTALGAVHTEFHKLLDGKPQP